MDEVVINVVNRVGNKKAKIINKNLCILSFMDDNLISIVSFINDKKVSLQ